MLDAASALRHLHHHLGGPDLRVHAFNDGRAVVRASLRGPDRPLVAVLCPAEADAIHARSWFAHDVETLEVAEGWLVVGRAAATARRAVPDTTLDDLDPRCVAAWRTRAGADESTLASFGVLALDGDVWRPTIAAYVLAARDPHRRVRGCVVRARIDGRVTTHVGSVPKLLDAVPTGRVDPWLVREALANALLHRTWSTAQPVRVRVEGDRLEVANPGVLRTTPTLAHELAVAARLIEPCDGLRVLVDRLVAARLPEHDFVETDGWVVFTARLPAPARRPSPTPRSPPQPPVDAVPARLPGRTQPPANPLRHPAPPPDPRRAQVLDQIRRHGRRTAREIAAALGCSRPVVGKVLTRLVAEGLVRQLSPGRSPFQTYELAGGRRGVAGG